jgi:polyisoprenyl-phosphate glycosyltransferase
LALGIIGEYLARVFVEVKQRPLYVVNRVESRGQVAAGDQALGPGQRP